MNLRDDLKPNEFSKEILEKLTDLASSIDGGNELEANDEVNLFNQLAGTSFEYIDFQEIYSGCDHSEWVESILLVANKIVARPRASKEELIEVIRRFFALDREENFLLSDAYGEIFNLNVPMSNAQSLLQNSKGLTPEEIVDIALRTDGVIRL